jgi:hypothetical protein
MSTVTSAHTVNKMNKSGPLAFIDQKLTHHTPISAILETTVVLPFVE